MQGCTRDIKDKLLMKQAVTGLGSGPLYLIWPIWPFGLGVDYL
jgi:hypothetical protein